MRTEPAVALLSAAAAGVAGASEDSAPRVSFECANPLFKAHWYTNDLEFSHLQGEPETYTRLERCPMWNHRRSCCNPSMEAPQQVAFDGWLHHLGLQVNHLEVYFRSLRALGQSEEYRHSEALERALFDRALGAFPPALAHAKRCVRAIMAFVAGMICFGCNPRWGELVWRSADGGVTAVNVSGSSCLYVDLRCGPFGRAVKLASRRVMESGLAKAPEAALPDFSMLEDRISSCEWLRAAVALQPLRGGPPPGRRLAHTDDFDPFAAAGEDQAAEAIASTTSTTTPADELRTSTVLPAVVRTTAAPTAPPLPTAPPYATAPRLALDPVQDGLRSGFIFPPE